VRPDADLRIVHGDARSVTAGARRRTSGDLGERSSGLG
jgi:hypothetical protein